MLKLVVSFLMILSILIDVSAQSLKKEYDYTYLGIEYNLPTKEVYELMQDHKGYIWALTEIGVYRFNGVDFQEIKIPNPFISSIPIDIIEDPITDLIWILFKNGKLLSFNYENNRIKEHPMNNMIESILNKENLLYVTPINNSLRINNNGEILFAINSFGCFIIKKNSLEHIPGNISTEINLKKIGGKLITFGTSRISSNNIEKEDNYLLKIDYNNKVLDLQKDSIVDIIKGAPSHMYSLQFENENYLAKHNLLIQLQNDSIKYLKVFENKIIGLKKWELNSLIIFFNNSFPVIYNRTTHLSEPLELKKHINITSVCKISDEEVWLSSLANGIISLKLKKFKTIIKNKTITSLKKINNKLYYGNLNGEIGVVNNKYDSLLKINNEKILGFTKLNAKIIAITSSKVYDVSEGDLNNFTLGGVNLGVRDFILYNNSLFMTSSLGLLRIKNDKLYQNNRLINDIKKDKFYFNKSKQKFSSIDTLNKKLIVSIKNKICYLDENSSISDEILKAKNKILLIRTFKKSIIYSTKNGLFIYNTLTKKNKNILLTDNFFINNFFVIDNKIWVATTKGLVKIDLDFSLYYFSIIKNFCNVYSIQEHEQYLYFGTDKGLYKIDKNELYKEKNESINLQLRKIKTKTRTLDKTEKSTFDYLNNSFTFYIDILNYKNRDNIIIKYRFSNNENWIETKQLKFEANYLKPNKYQFQVKACINKRCSDIIEYEFEITPPFWKRIDVWAVSFSLILLSIILYFKKLLKNIKEKRKQEQELIRLERKANKLHQQTLIAQMNPHFIFNALSSIQCFVIENDVSSSEKYLTDFAHLMRLTLESSIDNFICIKKEIKFLKSYLSLEQLRLDYSFEFDLNYDSNLLENDFMLPTMILQPLIENAIIHGVGKDRKGKIQINIKHHDGMIKCLIKDNQVKSKSNETNYKNLGYESKSSLIIKERIRLLKEDYNQSSINYIQTDNKMQINVLLPIKVK